MNCAPLKYRHQGPLTAKSCDLILIRTLMDLFWLLTRFSFLFLKVRCVQLSQQLLH